MSHNAFCSLEFTLLFLRQFLFYIMGQPNGSLNSVSLSGPDKSEAVARTRWHRLENTWLEDKHYFHSERMGGPLEDLLKRRKTGRHNKK